MKRFFILAATLISTITSCNNGGKADSMDLQIVTQTETVNGGNESNSFNSVSFDIDVPASGPQALADSVISIINREVYKVCELCLEPDSDGKAAFDEKDVFTPDGEYLLSHYTEKYKPVMKQLLFNTFSLDFKLEAQTDSYVTFGMVFTHCGGSCGSEKYYYTFDKRDGHMVRNIISHENLVRFFEENPEYGRIRIDPQAEDPAWEFSDNYVFDDSYLGLLDNQLSFVINDLVNHYFLTDFKYDLILPYLSPEVQSLMGWER